MFDDYFLTIGAKRTLLTGVGAMSLDKNYLLQEWITPLERRLYFTTAHTHFLAGCPALALEVLSKLPDHVQQPESDTSSNVTEQTIDSKHNVSNQVSFSQVIFF